MTAGIQIYSTRGLVQIDQDYRNVALVAKGTGIIGGLGASWAASTLSGLTAPLLATRITGGYGALNALGWKGPNVTPGGYGDSGANVGWWMFDVPPVPSAHGSGLQVFDDQARCVFDSALQYARVVDVLSDNAMWSMGALGSKTYDSSRTYAIAWLRHGWRAWSTDRVVGTSHYWMPHFQTNAHKWVGSTLSFTTPTKDSDELAPVGVAPPPQRDSGGYLAVILDVTGY